MVSQNILDQLGVGGFKNADDFQAALKQVNNPGTRWALGVINADQVGIHWFSAMFGAPNNWRNDGGKFTKDYETPEYKAAVAYIRSLWDQGLINPDTPGQAQNVAYDNFERGKTVFAPGLWTPFRLIWDDLGPGLGIDPNFKLRGLTPFGHDGSKGAVFLGSGNFALTVFKKASADRVQELLRIINYLAAPFGSQEYLTVRYGVKGVDYNFDDTGNPIYTQLGQTEAYRQAWWDLPGAPDVIYYPRSADFAKIVYPLESASYAAGVRDPSIGLSSETLATQGALLTKNVFDGVNQIIYGRAPVDSLDQLVSDWRNNGGDKIRAELQQAQQTAG
jgi:putative aldouronate transport system substrate-binding protein